MVPTTLPQKIRNMQIMQGKIKQSVERLNEKKTNIRDRSATKKIEICNKGDIKSARKFNEASKQLKETDNGESKQIIDFKWAFDSVSGNNCNVIEAY